jgi:hypothetical protein
MWTLSGHRSKLTFRQSRSQLELLVLERTEALQRLSQRLLRVQDEERRRLARDLHDSTGQTLTALKISVALLQKRPDNGELIREELSGIALLADAALQEIRTTSYLLHPPMLDEASFTSAAQCYVEGFARRSGMKVRLDFGPQVERLPDTIETVLFRVLQESLTNVHRHSGASEVEVRFLREARVAILEVRDYGCGIPEKLLRRLGQSVQDSGIGLAGMCERLNELKGDLEITSADPGTRLRAIVPLPPGFQTEEALNDRASVPAAATTRAIYEPCRTLMARAGKLPALTRSAWAALNRAKRIPLNVGRWEPAVGVAVVLVIACWIGFGDRRPPSSSGVSGLQGSNSLEQQIPFAPAKQVVANRTSKPQTALGREPVERKTFRTMPREVLDRNIRVRYLSDDVTVRYFIPQPPPRSVPDRNIRFRHLSEDVMVRYFPPKPVAPPSIPNGTPAHSVSASFQ